MMLAVVMPHYIVHAGGENGSGPSQHATNVNVESKRHFEQLFSHAELDDTQLRYD